ncbi:uncharacterized protein K452DRAFT_286909 [Aplosporella prunicola CBS 121167]|uniref:Peptide N-acetyl-beta-D-glucosaminyl asparaginase amidase A N-terminal domain-containing protein n=1 Tax=Aplosporella prunicola CBS 121167 TaxID=1176127 RepID=A0A6A6BGQ1_9PEZI|nr:uncharacterized protein K452DRAFT_286909 [Aplosporella prunicola CBS 121167]KAF2142495.1 hypothetical protein K452DRAFT_286909 [Aplosporella prunicola CBS 121167]
MPTSCQTGRPLPRGTVDRAAESPKATCTQSLDRASSTGPWARFQPLLVSLALTCALCLLDLQPKAFAQPAGGAPHESPLAARAGNSSTSLLDVFELDPPVHVSATPDCQQTLMDYVFANSYGAPFVGVYEPPSCNFSRVTFNFTVTSAGHQYDRLALMYFGDTEIFRTSTAEPTPNGIIWTYTKDMSAYLSLFRENQKIIFDMGNIVNDQYTASFNATLTAYFYDEETFLPADRIIPISARKSSANGASAWNIPADNATNTLSLPQNIARAIFSISANGQSAEEFWWANVLQSDVNAFGDVTELYGYSPWREVQLYIDGYLAGVVWPFPIIFTGGIVPGFWRPIVGTDAFDLKEDQIDITPWLPLLCDGGEHTFEIRVTGLNDTTIGNGAKEAVLSETVGSYWVVTGKLFLWLDEAGSVTTGSPPSILASDPNISVSSVAHGSRNHTNVTLDYAVAVQRSLSISATVQTSRDSNKATWTQELSFSNVGNFTDAGRVQVNTQSTKGYDTASGPSNTTQAYSRTYSYPLWVYSDYQSEARGFSINGRLDRGKYVETLGASAFPLGLEGYSLPSGTAGTGLTDRQNGSATYFSSGGPSNSTTEQDLGFSAVAAGNVHPLYHRHAVAANDSVVSDDGTGGHAGGRAPAFVAHNQVGRSSIKEMLGRGPGGDDGST